MSLTLRDVVESQIQLRASGVRRDSALRQGVAQDGRERFSLDASERQSAVDARSRASHARADVSNPEPAKTDASKVEDKPTKTERPPDDKSTPDRNSRVEPPKKPGSARATQSSSPNGQPQPAAAEPEAASEDAAKANAGKVGTVADQDESQAVVAVKAEADPTLAALPIVTALVVPPPVSAPSPVSTATIEGEAEAEGGIDQADGATGNAGPHATKAGQQASQPAATKPGFELQLADVSAANSGAADARSITASAAETTSANGFASPIASTSAADKAAAAAQTQALPPAAAPVPLGAVPMTIGLRALGASNRFEIRLDPKELGRIDVSIDIDKDAGTVGARLVVDRPETLALLQRDSSSLQQALAQTGLDASAGVSLSLRNGQSEGQRNGGEPGANGQAHAVGLTDRDGRQTNTDQVPIDLVPLRALRGLGRVDIRI